MDPRRLRSQFPVLERVAYLNAGSDGPVPAVAVHAAHAELDAEVSEGRTTAHFERRFALLDDLRAGYARALGCAVGDVALTTSTSEGLGRVLAGIELRPGDEIVTSETEHPGLIGPLLAAKRRGAEIRRVALVDVADAVGPRTRLVACSHVGWHSGELAPAALAELDVPVVLDGAQGVGAVPVDVRALGAAAYAAAGQKWLCGADGTGMLYLAPEFRAQVRPIAPSYICFEDASRGWDAELRDDARAHDTPSLARETAGFSLAALTLLESAGWDAVHARGRALAAELADRLRAAGRTVAPRDGTTLVAWEDADPPAARDRLAAAGVAVRNLPGTPLLRASVGAWNDESDLERLLAHL